MNLHERRECSSYVMTLRWWRKSYVRHHHIVHHVKYQECEKMCVCCVRVCVLHIHTHTQRPQGSAPTHSLRATHTVRQEERFNVKLLRWRTVETNSENTEFLSGPKLLNDQKVGLYPAGVSCWPAPTVTNTNTLHKSSGPEVYLVFVWLAPKFIRLLLNIMKKESSAF